MKPVGRFLRHQHPEVECLGSDGGSVGWLAPGVDEVGEVGFREGVPLDGLAVRTLDGSERAPLVGGVVGGFACGDGGGHQAARDE